MESSNTYTQLKYFYYFGNMNWLFPNFLYYNLKCFSLIDKEFELKVNIGWYI